MSTVVEDPVKESTVSLVGGILVDLQHLVEQQLQLTRREIEGELRRQSTAALIFALGMASLFLASVMLSMAFAHLVHWLTSPAGHDAARIPMWGCQALVAGVLIVIGGSLSFYGQSKFRWVQPNQDKAVKNM
ncbi:MAG: phage holin family protein [Schlesneria sp.]